MSVPFHIYEAHTYSSAVMNWFRLVREYSADLAKMKHAMLDMEHRYDQFFQTCSMTHRKNPMREKAEYEQYLAKVKHVEACQEYARAFWEYYPEKNSVLTQGYYVAVEREEEALEALYQAMCNDDFDIDLRKAKVYLAKVEDTGPWEAVVNARNAVEKLEEML